MVIRVTHSCQVSGCLCLLYLFRHILSCSQKLLTSQLLVISLSDFVYVPALNQHLLNRIQRIQNFYLHFSYCIRKYDHICPYYQRSDWLKIWQRFIFHLCCLVFFLLRSNTPLYLRRLLQLNSEHHSSSNPLVTRYQDCLSFPIYRSIKFCAAFSYISVKHFNFLPFNKNLSLSIILSINCLVFHCVTYNTVFK